MSAEAPGARSPKILVFSTNLISDVGIDLAGSSHLAYPASVAVLALPCSSGINPAWVVHALSSGFDGVFVAADGAECSFVSDCTARTAKVVERSQALLAAGGLDPRRVRMGAICSVCAEPFVNHLKQFAQGLAELPAPPRGG